MNILKNRRPFVVSLTAFSHLVLLLSAALPLVSCMAMDMASDSEGDSTWTDIESQDGSNDFTDDYYPPNAGTDDEPSALIPSAENGPSCESDLNLSYNVTPTSGSTAGAVLARYAIDRDMLPLTSIRDSEFLSYYAPVFAESESPQLFIQATFASDADEINMDFAVTIPSVETRPAVNLVLAVDTSTSMEGPGIEIAQSACRAVFDALLPNDILSIVLWNTAVSSYSGLVSFTEADKTVCGKIIAEKEAGTDIRIGLQAAYDAAIANASSSLINHVLFISDGGAPAGITDKDFVQQHAAPSDGSVPIFLSALGVASSLSMYNENLMKMFADAGQGSHHFADTAGEGRKILESRFFSHIGVAARNATLTLTVPPQFEALGGSEKSCVSNNPVETGFDPAPGSSMIFHEVLTPCGSAADGESDAADGESDAADGENDAADGENDAAGGASATNGMENNISWSLSFISKDDQTPQIVSVQPQAGDMLPSSSFAKVDIVLLFTDALREAKSGNSETALQKIALALKAVEEADSSVRSDPDVLEIVELLNHAKNLL